MAATPTKPHSERLRELQDKLIEGVHAVAQDKERWQAYLDYCTKMRGYQYSPRNQMLILMQFPAATMVRTFNQWKYDFGRHIIKGETALYLLAPVLIKTDKHGNRDPDGEHAQLVGFRPFPVFALEQTDGNPLPPHPFEVKIDQLAPEHLIDKLNAYAAHIGYEITREPRPDTGAKGATNYDAKTIWIKPDREGADYVRTITHELAHATLHDPQTRDPRPPRQIREIEAESASYMICKSLGVDTDPAAFAYLANWSQGNPKLVEAVFSVIGKTQEATSAILEAIDPAFTKNPNEQINAAVHKTREPRSRPSIDRNLVEEAKRKDPTAFLAQNGYSVKWEGYNADVREQGVQVARITRKPDGTYLVNSDQGDPKGDNIDLAKWVRGNNDFAEAVQALIGANPIVDAPTPGGGVATKTAPAQWEPVRLPTSTPKHRYWGRKYLTEQRGISASTLDHAEQSGMLKYGNGGVLFVGLTSQGDVGSAFRRGYRPDDPTPKRDLRGSQKQYAPILPGQDPSRVWIVEGGMDGLALHDLYQKKGRPTPTVIIAGGAGSTAYTTTPHIREIIQNATSITVAGDNDPKPETRARTAQHRATAIEQLQRINPTARVEEWIPQGVNDLADLNNQSSPGGKESSPKVVARNDYNHTIIHQKTNRFQTLSR